MAALLWLSGGGAAIATQMLHIRRRFLGVAAAAVLAAGAVYALAPAAAPGVEALDLTTQPVPLNRNDPAQTQVGRLRFMGALVLRSGNRGFGGLSALRAGPEGRLLAISDTGNWVSFVTVEPHGWLTGVRDGVIAPLRNGLGAIPADKEAGDAEALEWDPVSGDAVVSFEQIHRLQSYRNIDPARPDSLAQAAAAVRRIAEAAKWPANSGGEALAALGDGRMLMISEDVQGADGSHDALLIDGDSVQRLGLMAPADWHPTDAIRLAPNGPLLLLLRRLSLRGGFAARVQIVDLPVLTPGTLLRGKDVALLQPPLTVDNMEGMAVRRDGGRIFIYLISDDNFLPLQRNLLMKFELVE